VPTQAQALSHYARQKGIALRAVQAVRAALRLRRDAQAAAHVTAAFQLASAKASADTMAEWAGTPSLVRPAAFAGWTAAGFPLTDPLDAIMARIGAEVDVRAAELLHEVDRLVASEVADAGRAASQASIVAEPLWANYVRMLNPPSCSRCAILAGRIYRDLEAFQRHPLCDCVMVPVTDWQDAHDNGLISSPRDLFDRGEIRGLSQADSQAIADGADMAQVVNAQRGMATADLFGRRGVKVTTTGTTKRSAWRKANPNRTVRLRPEAIYAVARDREDAIRLLRLYGYLTS
jgi:hypothetical protein